MPIKQTTGQIEKRNIEETDMRIKNIRKTKAEWGIFLPYLFDIGTIRDNVFVTDQKNSNKSVSIGVHFNNVCHL